MASLFEKLNKLEQLQNEIIRISEEECENIMDRYAVGYHVALISQKLYNRAEKMRHAVIKENDNEIKNIQKDVINKNKDN